MSGEVARRTVHTAVEVRPAARQRWVTVLVGGHFGGRILAYYSSREVAERNAAVLAGQDFGDGVTVRVVEL